MRRRGLSARSVSGTPTRLLFARTVISQRINDHLTLIGSELMSIRASTLIRSGSTGFISTLRMSMYTLQSRRPHLTDAGAAAVRRGTRNPIVEIGSPLRTQRPSEQLASRGHGVSPSGQVMPTKLP